MKRWQDWGNLALGGWMLASPLLLGFSSAEDPAAQAAWVLGTAVVVLAIIAVAMPRAWEEAVGVILGIGLVAAPWVLDYTDRQTAVTNSASVGILVMALALWAMLADPELQKRWRDRRGAH